MSSSSPSDDELPSFVLPQLADNPDGWGPCEIPDDIKDIPFAPFSKSDRLGRISDLTLTQERRNNNRNIKGGRNNPQQYGAGTGSFAYKHEDDESSFSLVDNRPKPKRAFARRVFQPRRTQTFGQNQNNKKTTRQQQQQASKISKKGWGNFRGRKWGYNNYRDNASVEKESSVEIGEEWEIVDTMPLGDLARLYYTPQEAETLVQCGQLEAFNQAMERVSPKAPISLQRFENRQHFTATTSDDPVLQRLASERAGTVYATDTILALLMASPKSVNPWDIVLRKTDGAVFLDKRAKSLIDFLSVNENWNEVDSKTEKDSVNHPLQLSREATLINHNFSQQILSKDEEVLKFPDENPFLEALEKGHEPASVAYHYRRWNIASTEEDAEDIKLVARCGINGYTVRDGKQVTMTVRALNQFDAKCSGNVEWRQKLEHQSGAVLATEMKNNSNKLARWTAEASLSGTDEFRLGFVSRNNPKNSFSHELLMTARYKPQAFAQSVGVKIGNLWGTLRSILSMTQNLEDGTYLLAKDPNKPELLVIEMPEEAYKNELAGTTASAK